LLLPDDGAQTFSTATGLTTEIAPSGQGFLTAIAADTAVRNYAWAVWSCRLYANQPLSFDGTHADAGAAAGAFCFIDQRPLA